MKKLITLLLVCLMAFTLAACGGNDDQPNNDKENQVAQNDENQVVDNDEEQQDEQEEEQEDEQEDSDEQEEQQEDEEAPAVEWPDVDYITDNIKWKGAGTFTDCVLYDNQGGEDHMYEFYTMKVDSASMDEMQAFIDTLKTEGYTYYNAYGEEEPEFAFKYGVFNWEGKSEDNRYIYIEFWETPKNGQRYANRKFYNIKSQLNIDYYSAFPYVE